jgi:lysozyme
VARVAGVAGLVAALFTAGFEGDRNKVYTDQVGNKTVCVGHAYTGPDGTPLQAGATYTDDVCSLLLGQDIVKAQYVVQSTVKVPLSDGELIGYTDFTFNLGGAAWRKSSMLKRVNVGDHKGACARLLEYTKGKIKGKLVPIPGLVKRRTADEKVCLRDLG